MTNNAGNVRNVVLVGHSGSGKTTLVEALLGFTGAIQRPGRIEDGTTASDLIAGETPVWAPTGTRLALATATGLGSGRPPTGHPA